MSNIISFIVSYALIGGYQVKQITYLDTERDERPAARRPYMGRSDASKASLQFLAMAATAAPSRRTSMPSASSPYLPRLPGRCPQ